MSKSKAKDGVGQLVLQIVFPDSSGKANDRTEETQANGPATSIASGAAGSEAKRIAAYGRNLAHQPEAGQKRKWYSLIDKVYAIPNLVSAWEKVQANRGAAGMDGMTIQKFADGAQGRLEQLCEDLRRKTYRPQPVRRVYIPKSGGGKRGLGIPTVRDRVVQQALQQILQPIFESHFSKYSHGFRPTRGCATALDVVDRAVKHGYGWVVDADIQAFFDTVDQDKLLTAVNEEISDGSVIRLLRQILQAGVIEPESAEVEPTELGTPQGGPISPLLANIYLHRLDQRMEQEGYGLVRYADDFVIFTRSESEANKALEIAREILEGELGLRLHPEKTRVVSVDAGFEFLGFHYYHDPKIGRMVKDVRQKSVQRFRDTVRKHTPNLRNQTKSKARHMTPKRLANNQRLGKIIRDLNRFLEGWHWYFKVVWSRYEATPFRNFDGFVRARIRHSLTGRVGAGWWNARIPNALLRDLGLLSLDDLQMKYHRGQLHAPARKG